MASKSESTLVSVRDVKTAMSQINRCLNILVAAHGEERTSNVGQSSLQDVIRRLEGANCSCNRSVAEFQTDSTGEMLTTIGFRLKALKLRISELKPYAVNGLIDLYGWPSIDRARTKIQRSVNALPKHAERNIAIRSVVKHVAAAAVLLIAVSVIWFLGWSEDQSRTITKTVTNSDAETSIVVTVSHRYNWEFWGWEFGHSRTDDSPNGFVHLNDMVGHSTGEYAYKNGKVVLPSHPLDRLRSNSERSVSR